MNMFEILKLIGEGGVASLDGVVVIYMFVQVRSFYRDMPKVDDYMIFRDEERRMILMEEDMKRWRLIGKRLSKYIPVTILGSFIMVGIAFLCERAL